MSSITRSPRYPAASPETSSNASLPEIRVDHLGVSHDNLGRALGEDLSEVEDDGSFGELDDRAHHVLDPEDRCPEPVADTSNDVDGVRELRLVETCHHLVEQQQSGLSRQGLRHLEESQLVEVQA